MQTWLAIDLIAKATVLLLLAAIATSAYAKMAAATRHRVWSLAFLGLLALPVGNLVLPGWHWRIIPRQWSASAFDDQAGSVATAIVDRGLTSATDVKDTAPVVAQAAQEVSAIPTRIEMRSVSTSASVDAMASFSDRRFSFATLLLLAWGAGAICVLLPLWIGAFMNFRYRLSNAKFGDPGLVAILMQVSRHLGITRKVALLAGSADQMPMTFGFLCPVVVLPEGAVDWSSERQRLVICHELAHVKRFDVPIQGMARITCALYWFHPLVWWSIRRMRLDREQASDDCVLLAGQKASTYAAELLKIAREYRVRLTLASAALSMARPSQLEGRLLAVLDATRVRAPISWQRSFWLTLAAATIVLGFGVLRPALRAQTPDPKAQRLLHFPADRAVGTIYVRPATDELFSYSDSWKKVGEARGERRVPAAFQVKLEVSQVASDDLSFLQEVGPDEIQCLSLRNTQMRDDGFKHVGRLTGLVILDLQQTRITDQEIHHLSKLVKLRSIQLEAFGVEREGFGVGDGTLKILADLPVLERIGLRLTKVTDAGMAALARLKSLVSLDVSGTAVSDAGLVHLKGLPKLDTLSLGVYDEGAKVTDAGLKVVGEMTNLSHLDLSGTKTSDEGLRHLANLKQLKSLCLDSTKVTEAGLTHLEPLTALETVRLYLKKSEITDVGAKHLSQVKSLKKITANLRLSDDGIKALASLPRLEEFQVDGPKVTNEGVAHLAGLESLKSVSFHGCPITDDALVHLAGLSNLEELSLYETQVTGEGLSHLAHLSSLYLVRLGFDAREQAHAPEATLDSLCKLPGLRILQLWGSNIRNQDFQFLPQLRHLEQLSIECPFDDEGASYIGRLSGLKSLGLGHTMMTDVGIQHLANLKHLEYLRIDDGKFTDKGITALSKLRSLQLLYLNVPGVTDEGLKALAEQIPALQRTENWAIKKQPAKAAED